jgi:hypothetical protein
VTEAVWVVLISAVVGPSLVAVINVRLGKQIKAQGAVTERIRHQVENSHQTNFRDDLDSFRGEVRAGFTHMRGEITNVRADVAGVHSDILSIRTDVTELRRADSQQIEQIAEVQHEVAELRAAG